MSISELINEILSEWAYRVEDGMPDAKNPTHLKELSIVLSEMGLSHIKNTLIENLLTEKGKTPEKHVVEADKNFSNPILNKKVSYKDKDGNPKDGIVGNLLRLPKDSPGRIAAEKLIPPEGSPERDAMNQDLGGEGQPKKPEDAKGKEGGEDGGAPKEDPIEKAAQMFDPKADPAMAARLNTEKETLAKIAGDEEKEQPKEETKKEDDFTPIDSKDVAKEMPEADPETFSGNSDIPDGIGPDDLEKFNTDINKVKQIVDDAKAKGEKAPDINLCDITVPGTNLYCDDNLGIPRDQMPQFKGKPQPGTPAADMKVDENGEVDTEPLFKKMLEEKGIKVVQTQIPSDKLKATQKDLVGAKVVGMMGALEENPEHPSITAPIYVSRDGYVIDGHHRWAAIAAYNAKNPDKQIPMKVQVIDQDIKDAIPMCNKFAEEQGVAAKKADANKEGPSEQPNAAKEKTKEETTKVANDLKGRTTSEGEELDIDTTPNGSLIIGVEHGDELESTKQTIEQIQKLPKDTKVMFVGEGGSSKDKDGNIEFGGEQDEIRNGVKGHFDNAEESSWDENADVLDDTSQVYTEIEKELGSKSKAKAAVWTNMYGQDGPDENMKPEDYLDDEGKAWIIEQAKKGGSSQFDGEVDWNNLTDAQKKDLYELNYNDEGKMGDNEIMKGQQAYNDFRQKELDRKIKEAEDNGYTVIAPVGNSHVDMRRQRNKPTETQKNKEAPTQPTSAPDKKVNAIAQKALTKIKDGVKNWSVEEKEFFNKKVHNGNSPERRTFSESFKDKAKGAWESIKYGAKHEVHTFKEAGTGVKNFFSGGKVSESEKKALIEVAKKVAMAAAFGAAGGGLAHGAAAFGKHLMVEFVPHVVAETVLMGAGKAALFAGESDEDADMMKFIEIISKKLESTDIPEEIMADAIESYNKNKEKTEMKEELFPMIDSLIEGIIAGFIKEATNPQTGDWKLAARKGGPDGKIVYFSNLDNKRNALQKGTHIDVDKNLNARGGNPAGEKPTKSVAMDKDLQARVGREKAALNKEKDKKSTAPSGKLSKKMEEDDIFFSKAAVEGKATEADAKVDSLPIGAKEKAVIKGVIRKILKGQDLTKDEIKVASDWITFPATSDAKIYFASEAGNFKDHDKLTISSSMSEDARQQFNEFLENNEVFDAGHPVKKKSMVASKLTPKRTFTKVEKIKKDKEGNVTSVTVGNTTLDRIPLPTEKELITQFKKQGIQNPEQEAKNTIVAIERHNANVNFLASQKDIETIDFGHDTNSSEGRRDTIESIKKMMGKKLLDDFTKYYKGKANIPKEARNILNLINNLSNPYINPSGNAAEKLQQEIDAIAILMNNNPDFRAGVPDMQEIFDFVVKLGQGYAGFMPSASNWKVTDIVTYKPTQSFKFKKGESPAEAIAKNLQTFKSTVLIEGGSSVKYEKGGASAGLDKVLMTVYNKHKGFDTQKELVKLFDIYKWSFTPGEQNRVKSEKEIQAKEAELNDTLNRAVTAGIISPEERKEILAEGEKQAASMAAKVEKKVPFEKYKQCFGKTPEEQKKNYNNYKKQLGLWCKMGATAEVINNNDARYQLFGNLRTKYPKKGAPKHEVIDGVNVLSGMGWSYDPGISATGKDCKYISMNNANSSHIEPIQRKG